MNIVHKSLTADVCFAFGMTLVSCGGMKGSKPTISAGYNSNAGLTSLHFISGI